MYEPFSFDVTEYYHPGESVTIRVLIRHAPDEMGQIGKTSETFTQKSRFNYKWDFSTRLVNLGIWQKVFLTFWDSVEMTDLFVQGEPVGEDEGVIRISGSVSGRASGQRLKVKAECQLDDKVQGTECIEPESDGRFSLCIPVRHPALWYPNGLGEQPLYDLTLELYKDDQLLDTYVQKVGIRSIVCVQNDDAPAGARPYLFVVNGKRMYIKGVNITPLDHIYGDVPDEQVYETLRRAKEMNCNLVRVWGGGLRCV